MIGQWNRPEHQFTLTAAKAAFVIIDMQNFSCAPSDGGSLPRIGEVITQINKLADFCRGLHIPVIWVRQNITTDAAGMNAGLYPSFHDSRRVKEVCNLGDGTAIYPKMHFDPSADHVVFKNRYSAFRSNPPALREKLDLLMRKQLIIAGIAANVCVESTVRDAMQLDYEVILISNAVTAQSAILLEATLTNTRLFFGDVRTSEEIVEELGNNAF
ncbi:MAG: cysteine hydrolase [Phycisphaerae bacterium]|nr:cysteine hydrolase [Phycisphaerae bacterium]